MAQPRFPPAGRFDTNPLTFFDQKDVDESTSDTIESYGNPLLPAGCLDTDPLFFFSKETLEKLRKPPIPRDPTKLHYDEFANLARPTVDPVEWRKNINVDLSGAGSVAINNLKQFHAANPNFFYHQAIREEDMRAKTTTTCKTNVEEVFKDQEVECNRLVDDLAVDKPFHPVDDPDTTEGDDFVQHAHDNNQDSNKEPIRRPLRDDRLSPSTGNKGKERSRTSSTRTKRMGSRENIDSAPPSPGCRPLIAKRQKQST